MIEVPSAETSSRPPLTSFSSVDYTMPNEDKDAGLNVEEPVPAGMNKKKYFMVLLHQKNLAFKYPLVLHFKQHSMSF